ncbi:hypothetical protein [Vibrio crassostreae]|uniref:hypothetical protein n=1 Tax=Vibrio crassostreae TaxID=246167 RepID=UPI001B315F35|nr:hypothetical protein [Vibrio crassostreae]
MRINNKKGFTIVEAMLSIALVSVAQLYNVSHAVESERIEDAKSLGKKMAQVLIAMDKRVLLDGYSAPTGGWNKVWSGANAFSNEMLGRELIAFGNPVCGDPSGWSPKVANNNELALIECNLLNGDRFPFKFNVRAERAANSSAPNIIEDWEVMIYHNNNTEFEENFRFYAPIRQQAQLYDALTMTGKHEVSFVNRTSGIEIESSSACYSAKSNCGILFKYRNSKTAETPDDSYLKVDGSTALVDDLYFGVTAPQAAVCYMQGGTEVPCGFDYNAASSELNMHATNVTATNYHLFIEDSAGTPVLTYCNDVDTGVSVPCGISVVDDGGSAVAKAHLNKLHARELILSKFETLDDIVIRETFDNDDNMLTYSRDGLSYIDKDYGKQFVKFGASMDVDAANQSLEIIGDGIDLSSNGSSSYTTNRNAYLKSGTGDITFKNADNASSKALNGNMASQAFASQGVKIVKMSNVKSGSSTPKATCPSVDGVAPTVEARTYPNGSYDTFLKDFNNNCKTQGTNFIQFKVYKPVVTAVGGSGSQPWRNATSMEAKTNYSGFVSCDPNRDTAVSYQVDGSGSNWIPRFWFWAGTQAKVINNVNMMVMQYCDYSK